MKIKEELKELSSSKEELDTLLSLDYIYISRARHPDDGKLYTMCSNYCDWISKLRGPHEGPAKLANNMNHQEWFHGYVYGVDKENYESFEKDATIFALKTGYTFEKINVSDKLAAEQSLIFNGLFEEQ